MNPTVKVGCEYRVDGPVLDEANPRGVFTFHVHKPPSADPWDAADIAELQARVWAWWRDPADVDPFGNIAAREYFSDLMKLDAIVVTPVQPAAGSPDVYAPSGDDVAGASGAGMEPPQCAHLLTLMTDTDTRSGRGRIYFPVVSPLLGEGRPFGTMSYREQRPIGLLGVNLAAKIRGADDPVRWVLCVYSRLLGTSNAVTHFRVPNRVSTQRRRAREDVTPLTVGLDGAEVVATP